MTDTPETTEEVIETAAKAVKKGKKAALKVVESAETQVAETAEKVEAAVEEAATAASSRFGKAIEDAKASAATLKGEALDKTAALTETVTAKAGELGEKATEYAEQAKVVALDLARQGKTKATGALSVIGETIESNAGVIDEKLGVQYGDYARGAAHTLQSTAANLESKDIPEIGEEIVGFVRKSPVKALGIAAAAGFLLSRLFRRSGSSSDSSEA